MTSENYLRDTNTRQKRKQMQADELYAKKRRTVQNERARRKRGIRQDRNSSVGNTADEERMKFRQVTEDSAVRAVERLVGTMTHRASRRMLKSARSLSHPVVSDVSVALVDEEMSAAVKLTSDELTHTVHSVADETEDAAAGDIVPDEDEKVMLLVTDVWTPVEKDESESCEVAELGEADSERGNPATEDTANESDLTLYNEAVFSHALESTSDLPDDVKLSNEEDEMKLGVLSSKSAEGRGDNDDGTVLSPGEEMKPSVHQKAAVLDDNGDDNDNRGMFLSDSVTNKDDDSEVEMAVRDVIKELVDQVTAGKNDILEICHSSAALPVELDSAERGCEETLESASLSEDVSLDRETASSGLPEVNASVAENKVSELETSLSSSPLPDNKYINRSDSCVELMESEHESLTQYGEKSCFESETCAPSEGIIHEHVDTNVDRSDVSACFPLADETAAAVSDRCLELMKSEHENSIQDAEKSSMESEVCASSHSSECIVLEDDCENAECSDEPACFPLADEIAAAVTDFLADTTEVEKVQDLSMLHDSDGENDTVTDDANLSSADAVLRQQESSVIQLLQQADRPSSEPCDDLSLLNEEATEKPVDSEYSMPLAEDVESSSSNSTVSYDGPEVANESGIVDFTSAGFDVPKECSVLSTEPAAGDSEPCLPSSDQPDVPADNDDDLVSETVVEERDEEHLLPASEDVTPVADDGDEDFEIDLL